MQLITSFYQVISIGICILILFSTCTDENENSKSEIELFHWTCGAESATENGYLIAVDNPDILFSGGKNRVDITSRSGKFSVLADSISPFALSVELKNGGPGNKFVISVYRKSDSGDGLLIASNDDFWIPGRMIGEKDENGWQKLELVFVVPINSRSSKFKVYGWNNGKGKVYFDDISVEKVDPLIPSEFGLSPMNIYLSDEDKKKIESLVIEALDKGILVNTDDSWVKALIFYEDLMMKAKIRLKGDWTDHLKGIKWSFRIKLGSEHAWKGMKTFSIQNPSSRSFLDEYVAHKIFEAEDVLTPRYGFVPVYLNNVNLGLYAFEEHFEKQLVESKKRREGPILRFSEEQLWETMAYNQSEYHPYQASAVIEPFKSARLLVDSNLRSQFMVAQKLLYDYQNFNGNVHELFDVERMAKYCALTDLCSFEHGMNWHNQRFYYNPIISRLEPIAYDGNVDYGNALEANNHLEGVFPAEHLFDQWYDHILVRRLLGDEDFMATYIKYLRKYADSRFLEGFLAELSAEILHLESKIQKENPDYVFNENKFTDKAAYIRSQIDSLSPTMYSGLFEGKKVEFEYRKREYQPTMPKFFVNPYLSGNNRLEVFNYYQDSLQLIGIIKPGAFPEYFDENKALRAYRSNDVDVVQFEADAKPGDKLAFKVVGHPEIHERLIVPWPHPTSYDLRRLEYNIPEELFLRQDSLLTVLKGDYVISESVVIPAGYRVRIEEGVRMDFIESSTLLSYSPVDVSGSLAEPIEMTTSDGTGFGLNILQAKGNSNISHLRYVGMNAFNYGRWSLSGALNIYESDIKIDHLEIRDNQCEDALNIIRSDFLVTNSTFQNIFADAFDSDFSTGTLSDSWFSNVANDAVDFSGSTVEINDCTMDSIGDKGISGGEGSTLIVSDCSISKANVAIASKDKSMLRLSNIQMSNCSYGLAVFKKKPEYGPAHIIAEGIEWEGVDTVLLVEKESTINLDGSLVEGKKKNVAALFY